MSTSEKPKGIKAFKKSALVVLATTHAAKSRSSTPKIKRQKSKEANAIDVLHTFVDESLDNSPMVAMARDKCGIRDAMMLEG